MYNAVDAVNATVFEQSLSIIFFVLNMLAGHFVLLNVFLAIAVNTLMETFAKADLRNDHNLRWKPVHTQHKEREEATKSANKGAGVVKFSENDGLDGNVVVVKSHDIYLSHFWGVDKLGRISHARASAIGKLLDRHGFKTYNCDDSRNAVGRHSQINRQIQNTIAKSRVFAIFLTKRYKDDLVSEQFIKSQATEQFEYAIAHLSKSQIIVFVMEPCMLGRAGWGDRLNRDLDGCDVFDLSDPEQHGIEVDSKLILTVAVAIGKKISFTHVEDTAEEIAAATKEAVLARRSLFIFPSYDSFLKPAKELAKAAAEEARMDPDVIDESKRKDPTPEVIQVHAQEMRNHNSRYQFRLQLHDFVAHRHFDNFILTCIFASSVALACEDPLNPDAKINARLGNAEHVFVVIFTVEMMMKWIVLSLQGYFGGDPWNLLDFVCVFTSLLGYTITAASPIRVFRVFRILRLVTVTPLISFFGFCVFFFLWLVKPMPFTGR